MNFKGSVDNAQIGRDRVDQEIWHELGEGDQNSDTIKKPHKDRMRREFDDFRDAGNSKGGLPQASQRDAQEDCDNK